VDVEALSILQGAVTSNVNDIYGEPGLEIFFLLLISFQK